MDLSNVKLDSCGQCGWDATFGDVIRWKRTPEGKLFVYFCSACSVENWVLWDSESLVKLRAMLESKTEVSFSSDVGVSSADRIGRTVAGFRVDLEAINSLSDLVLFWDFDDRNRPWRVPREVEKNGRFMVVESGS